METRSSITKSDNRTTTLIITISHIKFTFIVINQNQSRGGNETEKPTASANCTVHTYRQCLSDLAGGMVFHVNTHENLKQNDFKQSE